MTATQTAIRKMAYYTARQATGKRQQEAIEHCKKLGVDHTAPSFKEAI